jgi:hypothetical protein
MAAVAGNLVTIIAGNAPRETGSLGVATSGYLEGVSGGRAAARREAKTRIIGP